MKPRIIAGYTLKMAEAPMSLKPRKVVDYVCDDVGSDAYERNEGNKRKENLDKTFYAIAHCHRESKMLLRAIKSRMMTL